MKKWATLMVPKDPMEAEVIKGKLKSEGIPVFLKREAISRIYAISIDGIGKIEILVPEDLLKKAREILEIKEK